MKENKKMLVSDYDNTFYISDEDIKRNILNVEEFKNNIFVIATGRSYFDFSNKLKIYPIVYDYLILNQGATILDESGNIIDNHSIEEDVKNSLIDELDLADQDTMFACSKLESRVSINSNDITKIHKKFDSIEQARKINDEINKKYSKYVISYLIPSNNAIEIVSKETNKAVAIQKIAEIENISKQNIFTIGDSYNDIEMIQKFNGYCVSNAVKEIKDISKKEYVSVSDLILELLEKSNG